MDERGQNWGRIDRKIELGMERVREKRWRHREDDEHIDIKRTKGNQFFFNNNISPLFTIVRFIEIGRKSLRVGYSPHRLIG